LERYDAVDKSSFSMRYAWMRSGEEQIASTGSNSGGFLYFYWSRSGGAVVGVFLKELSPILGDGLMDQAAAIWD
jgi:hypothetical protein